MSSREGIGSTAERDVIYLLDPGSIIIIIIMNPYGPHWGIGPQARLWFTLIFTKSRHFIQSQRNISMNSSKISLNEKTKQENSCLHHSKKAIKFNLHAACYVLW